MFGPGVAGNEDWARARGTPVRLRAPIKVIITNPDCFNVLLSLRKIRAPYEARIRVIALQLSDGTTLGAELRADHDLAVGPAATDPGRHCLRQPKPIAAHADTFHAERLPRAPLGQ